MLSIIIAYESYFLMENVNGDVAADIYYMKSVCETGNPWNPLFAHTTELMLLRPWFFFVPFYVFTHDLLFSAQCYFLLSRVLVIISCIILFKGLHWSTEEIALGCLSFFGLSSFVISYHLFEGGAFYSFVFFSFCIISYFQLNDRIGNKYLPFLLAIALYTGSLEFQRK